MNERFHCDAINRETTPATCTMRLENGWCKRCTRDTVTIEKEETVAFKKCPKCNEEQTSNAARKCHECGEVFKPKATDGAAIKTPRKSKVAVSPAVVRKAATNATSEVLKKEPRVITNPTYVVAVDFEQYPELHKRLVDMAAQEFHTPDMQLLALMHGTFMEMEQKAEVAA